jgi:hypothetical protein
MTHRRLYKGEPQNGAGGGGAALKTAVGAARLFGGYSGARGAEVAVVHPNRG